MPSLRPSRLLPALLPLVLLGPGQEIALSQTRLSLPRVETGRIAGSVEISSALTARRPRFRVYSDIGPGSVPPRQQVSGIAGELANVVLYLASDRALSAPSVAQTGSPARKSEVMAQANERFDPHVLPVLVRSRVEFPNRDEVYHNVFSLSSARTFDLGRYPKGSSKSETFDKPGTVQVFCHIHSDMSAVIMVLPNPFFAAPDSSGRYAIENVPPGEYTIIGWHERTKPAVRRVQVVAGQTTTINFSLPLTQQVEQ